MNVVGKKVFDDLYIHISALDSLDKDERKRLISYALNLVPEHLRNKINVIKINIRTERLSLLEYANFESDPFPTLVSSWAIEPRSDKPKFRTYQTSLNPPILHRKELLVGATHSSFNEWSETTKQAEALGLFENRQTIGFRRNWEKLIREKGFCLIDRKFSPIGNATIDDPPDAPETLDEKIQRHLTALTRASLSAPVQLLIKNGLLSIEFSFFDYGCGKGSDIQALREVGIDAKGWDPHYAPNFEVQTADVVNLGFVVNVIEDVAERAEAIHKSFAITKKVLAVSVMLHGPEIPGKPFGDGYITSRNTFQKYFSQSEFKDYLEHALGHQVFMVGPGVAFIFADKDLEQQFNARRFRNSDFTDRLLATCILKTPKERSITSKTPKLSKSGQQIIESSAFLDKLWELSLDLGRLPDSAEFTFLNELLEKTGSYARALRLMQRHFDQSLLEIASKERADELSLYMSSLHFEKRPAYGKLEPRIQRDVKYFFNDYKSAQTAGLQLLRRAADPTAVLAACNEAAAQGLGHLDFDKSLQFHIDLLDRLPIILRAYVDCGLLLWGAESSVQLIKIHIKSGKLTLLAFKDFASSALPLMVKRVKINLRTQNLDIFDYGSELFPAAVLYRKSLYMHEDMLGYPEQLAFDESLDALQVVGSEGFGPTPQKLQEILDAKRLMIDGFEIKNAQSIPDLDSPCGLNFRFRDFIECGETQHKLGIPNIPLNPETYTSLLRLATDILDPAIDYFGAIRLTYGFCSTELAKKIDGRIAPKLDQHAGHECNRLGKPICDRLGAAVDFIIEDENMFEVAQWIAANCRFDRIYFYGTGKPIHVSASASPTSQITLMLSTHENSAKVPKTMSLDKFLNLKQSNLNLATKRARTNFDVI